MGADRPVRARLVRQLLPGSRCGDSVTKAARGTVVCAATLILTLFPSGLNAGVLQCFASETEFAENYADADNAFINGNLDLSQSLLEQAAKQLGSSSADQLKLADCLEKQALVCDRQSHLQPAAEKLSRAISLRSANSWPEHPLVIEDRTRLSDIYFRLKQPERAAAVLEANLQAKEKLYGPVCPRLTKELGRLAQIQEQLGDMKKAAQLYSQMYRCLLPEPPQLDDQMNEYVGAMLCCFQKQGGEYKAQCDSIIQQLSQPISPSDENPDAQVARQFEKLANVVFQKGQYSLGRRLMQLAVDRRERIAVGGGRSCGQPGADCAQNDAVMASDAAWLAVLALQAKEFETAAKFASVSMEHARKDNSSKENSVPTAAAILAASRIQLGDFDGALKVSEEGLRALHGNTPEQIHLKHDLLSHMMTAYLSQTQWRQAISACTSLLQLIEEHPDLGSRVSTMFFLGGLYRNAGDIPHSQSLFQQAINIKKHDGVEDFELGEIYLALANNYAGLRQLEKANDAYRHALVLVNKPGARREVRESVIRCYSDVLRRSGQAKRSEEIAQLLKTNR